MIKEETRFAASGVMEGMTSVSALFAGKEAGVNDRPVFEIWFDAAKEKKKSRELAFLRAKCQQWSIPLSLVSAEKINQITVGNTHGGVVAICGDRTLLSPTADGLPKNGFLAFIEGIEDPYNFGYALRSLYAAGCDGIFVGTRNWLSAAGVVARASAGASEALPVFGGDAHAALLTAKKAGYRIITAGIRNSVEFHTANLKKPLVLVVGGEKRGISAEIMALSDENVRIDYGRDFRGSLSAAAAATVLGFEILHQNGEKKA